MKKEELTAPLHDIKPSVTDFPKVNLTKVPDNGNVKSVISKTIVPLETEFSASYKWPQIIVDNQTKQKTLLKAVKPKSTITKPTKASIGWRSIPTSQIIPLGKSEQSYKKYDNRKEDTTINVTNKENVNSNVADHISDLIEENLPSSSEYLPVISSTLNEMVSHNNNEPEPLNESVTTITKSVTIQETDTEKNPSAPKSVVRYVFIKY